MSLSRPLYLIGYRGTGKSTVGRMLAEKWQVPFVDLDVLIEQSSQKSIADIFAELGESKFRDLETAALLSLQTDSAHVVATGGGSILRNVNRQFMKSTGSIIWLTATPEQLWRRLAADPMTVARRPNLTPTGGLLEITTVLAERNPLYEALADQRIDTDSRSPMQVAQSILTSSVCKNT